MSAAANLAGLYVIDSNNQWTSAMPWSPVPIHTRPGSDDPYLALKAPCPQKKKMQDAVKKSKFFEDVVKENGALFKYLSEKTGWDIKDVHKIQTLRSVMYVYGEHNQSFIPEWYKGLNQSIIQYLAGLSVASNSFTAELKQLLAGPLINRILTYFDEVVITKDTPKFLMLSAHDSTVAALLNSMNHFDLYPPEFGATVIWEMYKEQKENRLYVKMFYKKYAGGALETIILDGCDQKCDYRIYRKLLESVNIDKQTWEQKCKL